MAAALAIDATGGAWSAAIWIPSVPMPMLPERSKARTSSGGCCRRQAPGLDQESEAGGSRLGVDQLTVQQQIDAVMALASLVSATIAAVCPRPIDDAVSGGSRASVTAGAVVSGAGTAPTVVNRATMPDASDRPSR